MTYLKKKSLLENIYKLTHKYFKMMIGTVHLYVFLSLHSSFIYITKFEIIFNYFPKKSWLTKLISSQPPPIIRSLSLPVCITDSRVIFLNCKFDHLTPLVLALTTTRALNDQIQLLSIHSLPRLPCCLPVLSSDYSSLMQSIQ